MNTQVLHHSAFSKSRMALMNCAYVFLVLRATAQIAAAQEPHLANIRQLTFGGTNAEAYFSPDGSRVIFQSTRLPFKCDQIFVMNADGSGQHLVSTGTGTTTCSYFFPDARRILYASTFAADEACLPRPDKSKGYVWAVYNAYDIYAADADGSNLHTLFASPGYDAEATVSPRGDRIVFTSSKDGDLELYTMNLDGSDVRRVTHSPGYDGGAFFSWDGRKLVYRAHHPTDSLQLAEDQRLLTQQLVKPTRMEIYTCDADGENVRQLTHNGAANFAPFFRPGDSEIIFSSNVTDPHGRTFQLYLMDTTGTSVEQITTIGSFNAFPMFSADGKRLIFVSDRNAKHPYEFNVFLADWKD